MDDLSQVLLNFINNPENKEKIQEIKEKFMNSTQNSQEEAEAMAYGKAGYYTASDLRNFINVTREVIESEEVID